MLSSNVVRVAGALAALGGGVLIIIAALVGSLALGGFSTASERATTVAYTVTTLIYLLGAVLVLGGLVNLYAHQSEEAGILGVIGFSVGFLGTAMLVGATWTQAFITPALAQAIPPLFDGGILGWLSLGFTLTYVLVSVGWLLFGVATFVAQVYPRPAAVLLIIGALISFIPLSYTEILLAAAIAWLGFFALFVGRDASVERGEPSRSIRSENGSPEA
jgi:hypothetical protein